jgi:excisionase family DNA binding protein
MQDDIILSTIRLGDLSQMIRDAVKNAFSEQAIAPQLKTDEEVLDMSDLEKLTGYKRSYLFKLVHERKIPFHKPNKGKLVFLRSEIMEWIKNSRRATKEEISQAVNDPEK